MLREILLACIFGLTWTLSISHKADKKRNISNETYQPSAPYVNNGRQLGNLNNGHNIENQYIPKSAQYQIQSNANQYVAPAYTNQHAGIQNLYGNNFQRQHYLAALPQPSEKYLNVHAAPNSGFAEPIVTYNHYPNVKQFSSPLNPQFQLSALHKERLQKLLGPEKYTSPHEFNPTGLPVVLSGLNNFQTPSNIVYGVPQNRNTAQTQIQQQENSNVQYQKTQGNPFVQYKIENQPGSVKADSEAAQQKLIDPSSILIHTTKQLKKIDPQYFEPQYFPEPVVAQHQHYLPKVFQPSNDDDPYERQVQSQITVDDTSKETPNSKEDVKSDGEKDDVNEEDAFEKGYHDAAYGFPAYNDEDGIRSSYHSEPYVAKNFEKDYSNVSQESSSEDDEGEGSKLKNNDYQRYTDKDSYYKDQKKFNPAPYYVKQQNQPRKKTQKKQKHQQARPDDYELEYDATTYQAPLPASQKLTRKTKRKRTSTQPTYEYGFTPLAPLQDDASSQASSVLQTVSRERPKGLKKVYKEDWFMTKTKSTETA